MSQHTTVNALKAAVELDVAYKTLLRWLTVGGSEKISGAYRVGKEWAIPRSEIDRIKERRQANYERVRDSRHLVTIVANLYITLSANAFAGIHREAHNFLETNDPTALLRAVDEYRATQAMEGFVSEVHDLVRNAEIAADVGACQ